MDAARYERINFEAFSRAMDHCSANPSERSLKAALRLMREQSLARPGGRLEKAQPSILAMGIAGIAVFAFLAVSSWEAAVYLRTQNIHWIALVLSAFAGLSVVQGRKAADLDREDRIEFRAKAIATLRVLGEACAAVVGLAQLVALDHRAHCTVEDRDALAQDVRQLLAAGVGRGDHVVIV